jgi:glutamine---fructose-6-phosphate transaminase (isomerizing)
LSRKRKKFANVLVKYADIEVVTILSRQTIFPTVHIPDGGAFRNYVELAAGWSLLVEAGLKLGVDLDKPVRTRKIGNKL